MVKRAGIGAVCSAPLKYVKPSKIIETKYPTLAPKQRLEGLLAIRKEVRSLNHREQLCVIFRHDDFPNEELFCHERWCKVEAEGPSTQLFGEVPAEEAKEAQEEAEELPEEVTRNSATVEDVGLIRNEGFGVDDDNDPAPENVPTEGETVTDNQTWGWSGICHRKSTNIANTPARLNGMSGIEVKSMSYLSMFLCFFPLNYLHEVLLKQLNVSLEREKEREIGLGATVYHTMFI